MLHNISDIHEVLPQYARTSHRRTSSGCSQRERREVAGAARWLYRLCVRSKEHRLGARTNNVGDTKECFSHNINKIHIQNIQNI